MLLTEGSEARSGDPKRRLHEKKLAIRCKTNKFSRLINSYVGGGFLWLIIKPILQADLTHPVG
jgi:hypothetical protein